MSHAIPVSGLRRYLEALQQIIHVANGESLPDGETLVNSHDLFTTLYQPAVVEAAQVPGVTLSTAREMLIDARNAVFTYSALHPSYVLLTGKESVALSRDHALVCERQCECISALLDLVALADAGHAAGELKKPSGPTKQPSSAPKKPKRSTERDEARTKIIAALTAHHRYANGSCLNLTPIVGNELARKIEVGNGSVSRFFQSEFKGHAKYRAACSDVAHLSVMLKQLNNEFPPYLLLENIQSVEARRGEGQRDDE